jgi:ribosomal protein L11 methylase PrmA
VAELLRAVTPAPRLVWDLGANTGRYSRVASELGAYTVAFDLDGVAVEANARQVQEEKHRAVLPLVMDLSNPSPSQGWAHAERPGLLARGPADVVLALALVHHLVIGNNVPLERVAAFLADAGEWLLIEFVPREDSQVQRLLRSREDIFQDYTPAHFLAAFERYFEPLRALPLQGTTRTLHLMRRRHGG